MNGISSRFKTVRDRLKQYERLNSNFPLTLNTSQTKQSSDKSGQNEYAISTYVLSCVANSSQCGDEALWEDESAKILKALNINKSEINFEDLGWYLLDKYPDLYRFQTELDKERGLSNISKDLLRIKTSRVAKDVNLPTALPLSEDKDFPLKSQKRHEAFLAFLEQGEPSYMEFSDMIKITGSLDYLNFRNIDKKKHNEFVNTGYQMMIEFIEGKLPVNKEEEVGQTYLFFKQILRDVTIRQNDLPFTYDEVLNECIVPQLENVRYGFPIKKQTNFSQYENHLNLARFKMNKRYSEDIENMKNRERNFSETMREHTFVDSKKRYHKDKIYYDALYEKILLKYVTVINKHDYGIKKYDAICDKIDRILNTILERKQKKDAPINGRIISRDM